MLERHFIFDIDGTLINTEKAIIKGLQELMLEEKGIRYAPEQLYFCLGIPGSQALAQLGIEDGIPEKLKKWDAFYNSHADDVSVYPEIPEILEYLTDQGIILGTITSKNQEEYDHDMIPLGLGRILPSLLPPRILRSINPARGRCFII